MSFEQNKKNALEIDELNIGSHLNSSLELDGINVTEDLIARTMEAINMQSTKDSDSINEDTKQSKPISIYKKTQFLVKVAAAVLILVVGIKAVSIFNPVGMKSKSDNSAKPESSFMEEDRAGSMKNADTNEAPIMDDLDIFNISDALDEDIVMDKESSKQEYTANNENYIGELTFTDIAWISQEKADTITIKSIVTNEIRTITDKEQIIQFYSKMENYCFMEPQYNIKLMGEDLVAEIVIGLGEVVVNYTNKDVSYEIIYSSTDLSMLLEGIRELLVNK